MFEISLSQSSKTISYKKCISTIDTCIDNRYVLYGLNLKLPVSKQMTKHRTKTIQKHRDDI
jgi:hypothetical protein